MRGRPEGSSTITGTEIAATARMPSGSARSTNSRRWNGSERSVKATAT